jgi:CRP-like cAMP-binding protein
LLKITTWNTPIEHTTLTTEDEVCDSLFYVLQGKTEVSKVDSMFTLNPYTFVGEVGYFLRSAASATTIIEKGSVFVSWKTPALRELEARSPGGCAKIYEVMNKDMAAKVANSHV